MRKFLTIILIFSCVWVNSQNAKKQFIYQNVSTACVQSSYVGGYGYLYNLYAVKNSNFCPTGWRVANYADITHLSTYLGGDAVSGGKLKENGTTHYECPNTSASNNYGFNGLPGGLRSSAGSFTNLHHDGFYISYWVGVGCYYMAMGYNYYNLVTANASNDKVGYSVRLVKNNSTDPGTLTDYDGNVYNTVKIDTTVWISQNWYCTHLNDGTSIPVVTNGTSWAALTTLARCVYNNDESNK